MFYYRSPLLFRNLEGWSGGLFRPPTLGAIMFVGIDLFGLMIEVMPQVFTLVGGEVAAVLPAIMPGFATNSPLIMPEVPGLPTGELSRSHTLVDPLFLLVIPCGCWVTLRSAISAGLAREGETADSHQGESGDA